MAGPLTEREVAFWNAIWPASDRGRLIAPVRVGMDRRTGKMLIGFPHVLQSLGVIFATRFHERIFREWCGSFVPHLLGENATQLTITQFFWAIATAIELFEPCYRVDRVLFSYQDPGLQAAVRKGLRDLTIDELRSGHVSFKTIGDYMPRGHLGDKTVESRKSALIRGRGSAQWEVKEAA